MSELLREIVPWLSLAVATAALAFAMYSARSKRMGELEAAVASKADGVTVSAMGGKLGMVEDECIRIRSALEHMPDRNSMHRLEISLLTLQSDVKVLAEGVKPIKAVAMRLQEAILEKAQTE